MSAKSVVFLKALITALVVAVAGCGSEDSQSPTKEEIQFNSHLDQARFFQRQGQLKASIVEAQNAVKLNPSSREPFLIIAETLLITGDTLKAQEAYRQMLEIRPEEATDKQFNEAVLGLAKALLLSGNVDEAREQLATLRAPDAEELSIKATIEGNIELAAGNYEAANASYTSAVDSDANNIDALLGLSKSAYLQEDKDSVAKYLTQAEQKSPNNPDVWLWKGHIAGLEEKFSEAEDAYIRALEDVGQYDIMTLKKYQTISQLVKVLRAQGKHAEAFTYQEVLDKSGPGSIKNSYTAALEAVKQNDFQAAEKELLSILEKAPGHKDAGILLGMVKYQQGDWEAADRYLSRFTTSDTNSLVTKALASAKLKLRQPEAALKLLDKLPKDDPDALSMFGVAKLSAGNVDTGIDSLEKALKLDPQNYGLTEKLARAYIIGKQPNKAVELLRKSIDADKKYENYRALLVSALMQAKKEEDAAWTEIKRWKKEFPNSGLALNAQGVYYSSVKKPSEAEKSFKSAQKADPEKTASYRNLIRFYAQKEDWDKVYAETKKTVRQFPDNLSFIRGLFEAGKKVDKIDNAVLHLESIANKTKSINLTLVLSEYFGRTGNFDKALSYLSKAKQIEPENRLLTNVEILIVSLQVPRLIQENKVEEARTIATNLQLSQPQNIDAQMLPPRVELLAKQEARALELLKEVKQKFPDSPVPFEAEGDYYFTKKDFDAALNGYQLAWYQQQSQKLAIKMHQTLKMAKDSTGSLKPLEDWISIEPNSPQALTLLAMGYQANGMPEKAIEQYEKITAIRPNDAVALNNLAWLYFEANKPESIDLAKKAYDLQPENAAIADTYGWILFSNKKINESVAILEKAHKLDPNSEEIKQHLAAAYEASGQSELAKKLVN